MHHPVRVRRRDDKTGVSEIIGTMLILTMTVVLFAGIIIWVNSFPTPKSATRLDFEGRLSFDSSGGSPVANITIVHKGGDTLQYLKAKVVLRVTSGSQTNTARLETRGTNYGLIDGSDKNWETGERWNYRNGSISQSDIVVVIIIDVEKNLLLWDQSLTATQGDRPPVFTNKWADRTPSTLSIDTPVSGAPFRVLASVADLDGDLKTTSVYVIMAFLSSTPVRMYDDGTHGDVISRDGVYTSANQWTPPSIAWDRGAVRLNASDARGHSTVSWFALEVLLGPDDQTDTGNQTTQSGRPTNFICSGDSCYNIFRGGTGVGEWDRNWKSAVPYRTFTESQEVVVAILTARIQDPDKPGILNNFEMFDPFAPTQSTRDVIYGTNKQMTKTTTPSSTDAFLFDNETNGYNLYVHRYQLNTATQTNFAVSPQRSPLLQYFFTQYSLTLEIKGTLPLLNPPESKYFKATDQIRITSNSGYTVNYPDVATYSDSGFTTYSETFTSTGKVYVGVNMSTTDPTASTVTLGNVVISDYVGGQQVNKAPANGREANSPLCAVNGVCTAGTVIIGISGSPPQYRFMIDLSQANQDPWVEGVQNYALSVLNIRDSNEAYNAPISIVIQVSAPIYKLDIVDGSHDVSNSAWGTHDISYYYENLNGVDRWRKDRVETGPAPPASPFVSAVKFGNLDTDTDLDIAESETISNGEHWVYWYRRDVDSNQNTIWTRYPIQGVGAVTATDLDIADLTKDGIKEVVVGADNGGVWYYKNDGSWTRVNVDLTRTGRVNQITTGDFDGDEDIDIAVARDGGQITYYLNADGFGAFSTSAQTDQWYAEYEVTGNGTRTNSYTDTFTSNDVREGLKEVVLNQSAQSGNTANAAFDSSCASWQAADWETGAKAQQNCVSSSGNPGYYGELRSQFSSNNWVSGYWFQPFTVTGSSPFTAAVDFDWHLTAFGSKASQANFYVFVDTTAGAPVVGQEVWTVQQNSANAWTTVTNRDVSSKITGAGTYYLKVALRVLHSAGGSGTDSAGGFDNVYLDWSSSSGQSSALDHYWRIQQLPNRANSAYFFNLEGHHTANTEGDDFRFEYSTTGQTGTYGPLTNITSTSDSSQSIQMPNTLGGAVVWIRVTDKDRTVGSTVLDTVNVDRMYIEVQTSSGSSGSDHTIAGTDIKSIDADDRNADGKWDAVVGTANGKIYLLAGTGAGLAAPSLLVSPGGSVVGVKFAGITSAQSGLEIVAISGANLYIYTGTGTLLATKALPGGHTGTALGAGDVDADGNGANDDDVVVATGSGTQYGEIYYYRNQGGDGTAWDAPRTVDDLTVNIYDVDLGDADKSDKVGR